MDRPHFILASASPRRLQLLQQAYLVPDEIITPDIDESPHKNELPTAYVGRVARQKVAAVAIAHPNAVVLAADTVVACGRRILPKAEDAKTARECLKLLSGRRHRVYTGVCISAADRMLERLVMTQVKFARLSGRDIDTYIASGEWEGKAGGYAIQGSASRFIPSINGSYTNVVGLPLAEVCSMLAQIRICAKQD